MAEKLQTVVPATPQTPRGEPATVGQVAAAEARAVQVATQLVEQSTGGQTASAGGRSGGAPDQLATAIAACPFTIYYDYSSNDWQMDLPEGSVTVNGIDITPYELGPLSEGTWYLNIYGLYSATPGSTVDPEADDEADMSIMIATIERGQVMMQYLYGALHLVPGEESQHCFEPEYDEDGELSGSVTAPYIMVGRKIVEASGNIQDNALNGVVVTHSNEAVTAHICTITGPAQDNSDPSETTIPLYTLEEGNIKTDYRGMPVIPLYDPPAT